MSKRKSNKPVETTVEEQVVVEEQVAVEAPAQVATVVPTEKQSKATMRGRSTIESPVAVVWLICHNAMVAARNAGTERPSRKALFDLCKQAGIAPYTARTQIQLYLKASGNGASTPVKHPKNLRFD